MLTTWIDIEDIVLTNIIGMFTQTNVLPHFFKLRYIKIIKVTYTGNKIVIVHGY